MKDYIKRTSGELENAGWLQMKAMLDQHMPVKDIDPGLIVVPATWWSRIPFRQVAILIPFICISIFTGRQGVIDFQPVVQEMNITNRENTSEPNITMSTSSIKDSRTNNSFSYNLSSDEKLKIGDSKSTNYIGLVDENNMTGRELVSSIERSALSNSGNLIAIEKIVSPGKPGTVIPTLVKDQEHISTHIGHKKVTNRNAQSKIKLKVGVGYNASSVSNVYPVLAVSYHPGKRSALTIGMDANVPFSPKDVSKRAVSFINDTSMNVQFEVSKEKIDKLVYFNVPLEYSYKLKKDLSLISGMELSLLHKVHTSKQNEVYDYSSSPARILGPAVSTYVNGLQRLEDRVEARHTNIKVNAGLAYSRGPASIQAKYHYNLQEPILIREFNGNLKGGNKGTFSIRLLYQL